MKPDFKNISVEALCKVIDLLDPSMDDYLYVYDCQNDLFYMSPHAVQRFAITENAIQEASKTLRRFVYSEDIDGAVENLDALLASEDNYYNRTYRWLSKKGEPVWLNVRGYVVRDDNKNVMYLAGCINEIGKTSQKADNLSGLLSVNSLKSFLAKHEGKSPNGYFLRIGLDDLKGINARLGVDYGNTVLRKTAECISKSLAPDQYVFRIVEDQFMIVDFTDGSADDAKALYKRIQQAINSFIVETNYEVVFTISAGYLSCRDIDDFTYSRIMSLTVFAIDEAKRRGKNMCYIYHEEDYQIFLRRKKIMLQLQQAVNRNFEGFEVYYQPLFNPFTGELSSAEALMRFRSEEYGMVSPAEFIPILEETTLIIPAGRWILHEALKMCKQIKQKIPSFHISINISYVQVLRSHIDDEIIAAISEHQLSPSDVTIELTESGLLESNIRFAQFWSNLKNAGVSLALDDFGTGYSNFRYLAELSPNIVKIDRTFTSAAIRNDYDYDLLFLFSKMVHKLNLEVCVEGVETEHEFSRICELPPEYIQGYYLGRPCPMEQFITQFVKA